MIVFFLGDNQEILESLAQHIPKVETFVFCEAEGLIIQVKKAYIEKNCLILFDINNPVKDFEQVLNLIKTNFPDIHLWAIFDWESPSLKNQLLKLGFTKVLSYRDDLESMILGGDEIT